MNSLRLPMEGGLLLSELPEDIVHSEDKLYTDVYPDASAACEVIAEKIVRAINEHGGSPFRLGLTTGSTPITLYRILSDKYRRGEVSFKDVEIFSIDEYYPIGKDNAQSRNARLRHELIDNIDIPEGNFFTPDATLSWDRMHAHCAEYDRRARFLDLLVIGFGDHGQVGFNDAGSSAHSRTRTVMLSYPSRKVQARNFNGEILSTPKMAVTMGLETMMSARKVYLMAWGETKAEVVRQMVEGDVDVSCPASIFQHHSNVHMFVDQAAGSLLTREVAPWKIGPCDWTGKFRRKAVCSLSGKLGKPILKLTMQDYLENSLEQLLEECGPYDKINIDVFNDLQHTITGWPGGKPGAVNEGTRPVPSTPFPKRVLVFSPHPDDDVISMGGTLIRLVHQGHEVHVAYQTSGDLAVHNDVVIQHMDAARELGFADRYDEVRAMIEGIRPGDPDPKELLAIKASIRRSEARGACRSFGLPMENIHFLNLPFYESGGVTKLPRTQKDTNIIKDLLREIQPDQIYMAGDFADPHGTHRVCTEVALEALDQLMEEGCKWVSEANVWLYRGAWMEWEIGKVDMAVPLSPDEVIEKRHAIYHHLSQKDIVPFPGDDPREFWQRAEERTQNTARLYDGLGMAEYQAIEVFLKLR